MNPSLNINLVSMVSPQKGTTPQRNTRKSGLWGMESTSVIQQKGLPKDCSVHIKGDSLVSQKGGEAP